MHLYLYCTYMTCMHLGTTSLAPETCAGLKGGKTSWLWHWQTEAGVVCGGTRCQGVECFHWPLPSHASSLTDMSMICRVEGPR